MTETMADRINSLIAERGSSIRAEAEAMGVPDASLRALALGKVRYPRAYSVLKVSRHFGVTWDWLYAGQGPKLLADLLKQAP